MENFQRYFLIACVFIMSYFLIIRWDPPHSATTLIDSEAKVSTNSQNEDFGFIDEGLTGSPTFVPDVPDGNCDSSANYIIDSKKWKISFCLLYTSDAADEP